MGSQVQMIRSKKRQFGGQPLQDTCFNGLWLSFVYAGPVEAPDVRQSLPDNKRVMWRKLAWTGLGLFAAMILVAVLFPHFAQGDRYSGPGVITDALVLDHQGQPLKNMAVQVYLRGHRDKVAVAQTDELGELIIDRHKLKVDAIVGYERRGLTEPDASGYYHPIFVQLGENGDRDFQIPRMGSKTKVKWPGSPHHILDRT